MDKSEKKRNFHQSPIGLFFLFLVLMLIIPVQSASAGEGDNYTLHVDYSIDNHGKGIPKASFTLVKVMDLTNGTYDYRKDNSLNFDEKRVFSEESAKEAVAVYEQIEKNPSCIDKAWKRVQKTDKEGRTDFVGLQKGIYFLYQSSAEDEAASYETASPGFVQIPDESDPENMTVTVYPKTRLKVTPTVPSSTGEEKHDESTAGSTSSDEINPTESSKPTGKTEPGQSAISDNTSSSETIDHHPTGKADSTKGSIINKPTDTPKPTVSGGSSGTKNNRQKTAAAAKKNVFTRIVNGVKTGDTYIIGYLLVLLAAGIAVAGALITGRNRDHEKKSK